MVSDESDVNEESESETEQNLSNLHLYRVDVVSLTESELNRDILSSERTTRKYLSNESITDDSDFKVITDDSDSKLIDNVPYYAPVIDDFHNFIELKNEYRTPFPSVASPSPCPNSSQSK